MLSTPRVSLALLTLATASSPTLANARARLKPRSSGWGPGRWATTLEMELTSLEHQLLPKET